MFGIEVSHEENSGINDEQELWDTTISGLNFTNIKIILMKELNK
jgi:hypothetical protein